MLQSGIDRTSNPAGRNAVIQGSCAGYSHDNHDNLNDNHDNSHENHDYFMKIMIIIMIIMVLSRGGGEGAKALEKALSHQSDATVRQFHEVFKNAAAARSKEGRSGQSNVAMEIECTNESK